MVARLSQLTLLDDHFIIRKYNELNHSDHAQMNINSDKKHKTMISVQFPNNQILIDYGHNQQVAYLVIEYNPLKNTVTSARLQWPIIIIT